jgi:polyisoprenoid-binding protein YceI
MNKLKISIIAIVSGLMIGCTNNKSVDKPTSSDSESTNVSHASLKATEIVEVPVDITKSIIKWRGTKFLGAGSHEGTVRFKKGTLLFSDDQLAGGEFTVDMKTIYNTDIPKDDPIPRKNLTSHLNSDFETNEFSTASFIITQVDPGEANTFQITGDMTIRGITKSITINTTEAKKGKEFTTQFAFDRFDWKIGEGGSWLEKKVVDAEITLSVIIKCKVAM